MRFKLMTPERTLFTGEAVSVSGRAPGGDFEVLDGHGAWVSPVGISALRVELAGGGAEAPGGGEAFAVHGGVIEVTPDSVLVLADVAESAGEIDVARAGQARERAREHLERAESEAPVDADRARRALARAAARLKVSART